MTIKDEAVREDILYEAPSPSDPKLRIVLVRGVEGFATVERNGDGIDRERREHGTNFLEAVRAFNERASGAQPPESKPDSLAAEIREVVEKNEAEEEDEDEWEEEEEETGYEMYLENRTGTHLKFYEVKVEGEKVIRRWGRIGTAGRTKVERYLSSGQAEQVARDLVSRKLKRGYSRA